MNNLIELQAHKDSMDLWYWLWKNPTKYKSEYPLYTEKITFLAGECPLCHFHHFCCSECCLKNCIAENGDHTLWAIGPQKESAKHAKNIYKTIRNKYARLRIKEL